MTKSSRSLLGILVIALACAPLLACAQDADDTGTTHQKLENLLWGVFPFLILGVLFWFFFIRQIKKQGQSPAVLRYQAHLDRHEQYMERMEQAVDRIARALEKEKPE